MLRVSPLTIRRFIAAGRLSAVKAGKGARVRKESVEEFISPIEPTGAETEKGTLKGRPLTRDDALRKLVGSAASAEPTDASRKHEYLAEASGPSDR